MSSHRKIKGLKKRKLRRLKGDYYYRLSLEGEVDRGGVLCSIFSTVSGEFASLSFCLYERDGKAFAELVIPENEHDRYGWIVDGMHLISPMIFRAIEIKAIGFESV
jgi:hypothetical protein